MTKKCLLYLLCCRRMPWIALKVLPAGYVATSSLHTSPGSADGDNITAMAVSSGVYAFYQVRSTAAEFEHCYCVQTRNPY